jgi:hypothetical protein
MAGDPAGTVAPVIETPASPSPSPAPPPATTAGRSMTRAQANVIRAFCLWTVWVWATRLWNIWVDNSRETGFKVVHAVLAVVSVGFAMAAWLVVRNLRARPTAPPSQSGPGH